MRTPLALLAALLATALFAGCVIEPTSQDAPRQTSDPWRPSPEPSQPIPSDDPEPGATEARELEPAGDEPASQSWTSTPVNFQGQTAMRICRNLYTGLTCLTIQTGENTSVPLDGPAIPVFLRGNLTWDASTDSTGHLLVFLMVHNGEEYMYRPGWGPRVYGESPLRVSFDLAGYGGQKLALGIGNDECLLDTAPVANCAFAGAGVEELSQDFTFEGHLTGWTKRAP